VEGAVETVIDGGGGTRVHAGYHDDPFFFDLQGFRTTLMTGTLSFVNDRDSFADQNDSAVVIEMPLDAVSPTNDPFSVWVTTARAGG
jgi:hypothetical protein